MTTRLAVVGDGLIGRSIRLAWQRRHPDAPVRSLDRGADLSALHEADIVVLAAPVDAIVTLLPEVAGVVAAHALVTDVGSTKRAIIAAARTSGLSNFVGGHPMAGGTSVGPAAARPDLFDGRPWFVLTRGCPPTLVDHAVAFVAALGASPERLDDDGEAHDRLVAAISHLPQVVASALLARVGEQVGQDGLRRAGAGLRDTTRLARSEASVWAPILAANAAEVAPLLRALARDLEEAAAAIDDPAAVQALFARARRFAIDP